MKIALAIVCLCSAPFAVQAQVAFDASKAQAHCEREWTKRGALDTRMFNYCMEKQKEGYGDTIELYNRYSSSEPVEFIDEVLAFATSKWLTSREYQFNMVAYEIENQGEAFLNIQYALDSGSVGESEYNRCKSKWLSPTEPQWNMVEYCLKN